MLTRPTISDPTRRGHPIRRHLPRATRVAKVRNEDDDLKLFALSFTAFFICFYTFLI